ncbi:hypothetical protein AURDEDRAFT_158140 [Auricularia subglabra TFB-10046 SS5]|nr:hypothetical protein AURDEDRAFT_158140 [Auricularia subglabra TFB-10046 SS5]
MDEYIGLVKSSFSSEAWDAIAADQPILNARDALLATSPSVPEKDRRGPTVKLLNLVSVAVFDAYKARRPHEDQDVAAIFASRPKQSPAGDFLRTQLRPDYLSFSGTRDQLLPATIQQCDVPGRVPAWAELGSVGEQQRFLHADDDSESEYAVLEGTARFEGYLTTLKCYRPDIPTVHGFRVNRQHIQLWSLNACGVWSSNWVEISQSLDPWIAFVYLVYQSYGQRDKKLRHNAQQNSFVQWDVFDATGPSPLEKFAITPFYAAYTPGRGTFAAFQVNEAPMAPGDADSAFFHDEVKGFWKTSWQQCRRSKERQLLDRLHGPERWIPGLVRVYPSDEDETQLKIPSPNDIMWRPPARTSFSIQGQAAEPDDAAVQASGDAEGGESGDVEGERSRDEDTDSSSGNEIDCSGRSSEGSVVSNPAPRDNPADASVPHSIDFTAADKRFIEGVQVILHIASIGEPLSQCETPRELLYTAYDLLETYDHLWDEEVMHCDISWFNVMCKPRHYLGDKPATQDRPCIRKLMQHVGHPDGQPLVSSVLLADLDLAVDMKQDERHGLLRERMGTPMFISSELCSFQAIYYKPIHYTTLSALRHALRRVEKHPLGPTLINVAFPSDNGNFMANLKKVIQLEKKRTRTISLPERPIHNPRHDAESMFWVYLWAFMRARPRGAPLESDAALQASSIFCNRFLSHEIGDLAHRRPDDRLSYLHTPDTLRNHFHGSLAVFEDMFIMMATYLQVPWHIYSFINANHAQVAFRRIVCGVLLKTKSKILDLPLDTEGPRPIVVKTPALKTLQSSAASSSDAGRTGQSNARRVTGQPNTGDELRPSEVSTAPSLKRKASNVAGGENATKKRAVLGGTPQATDSPAAAPSAAAAEKPIFKLSTVAMRYIHTLHAHRRDSFALCVKVWKDRTQWFSSAV